MYKLFIILKRLHKIQWRHGGISREIHRHPGIKLPASWQTPDGEKPASRRVWLPLVCKECFAFVKSDYRYPFQLKCKLYSPNIANFCFLETEKFVLEIGYRETRPPFWDALISRYRHPMTNRALWPRRTWHYRVTQTGQKRIMTLLPLQYGEEGYLRHPASSDLWSWAPHSTASN